MLFFSFSFFGFSHRPTLIESVHMTLINEQPYDPTGAAPWLDYVQFTPLHPVSTSIDLVVRLTPAGSDHLLAASIHPNVAYGSRPGRVGCENVADKKFVHCMYPCPELAMNCSKHWGDEMTLHSNQLSVFEHKQPG